MKIETDNETYKKLKERIAEIMPEINVRLVSEDKMLRNLGFVDFLPCTIELQATEKQLEKLYLCVFSSKLMPLTHLMANIHQKMTLIILNIKDIIGLQIGCMKINYNLHIQQFSMEE